MITKIPAGKFGKNAERMGSRWGTLVDLLEKAKSGDAFEIKIPPEENDGDGRRRVRQGIYAIARYYQIRVRLSSSHAAIQVQKR